MKVFIEYLGSAKTFAVTYTQAQIFHGVEAQIGARAYNDMLNHGMLVETGSHQQAQPIVLPLVLREKAFPMHFLSDGGRAVTADIIELISGILPSHRKLGRHKQQFRKIVRILCSQHIGKSVGTSVRRHAFIKLQPIFVRQSVVNLRIELLFNLFEDIVFGYVRRFLFQIRDEFILDRKSTRLNSSHANISYAVFCLKKKTKYYK